MAPGQWDLGLGIEAWHWVSGIRAVASGPWHRALGMALGQWHQDSGIGALASRFNAVFRLITNMLNEFM